MMTDTTNGYGKSTVATAYIFERIHYILDNADNELWRQEFSNLSNELSVAFHNDTGLTIYEQLASNRPD